AHQQSSFLVTSITRRANGGSDIRAFHYRDFGSLVSLGTYHSVGTLMGFITGGTLKLEGLLAKLFYMSLYRLHIWALYGFWRMALHTLAPMIRSQTEPKVKLHSQGAMEAFLVSTGVLALAEMGDKLAHRIALRLTRAVAAAIFAASPPSVSRWRSQRPRKRQ